MSFLRAATERNMTISSPANEMLDWRQFSPYDAKDDAMDEDIDGGFHVEKRKVVKTRIMKVPVILRVINAHDQLCCNHPIDLTRLHRMLSTATLHLDRATMLSYLIMGKRIQYSPKGTV